MKAKKEITELESVVNRFKIKLDKLQIEIDNRQEKFDNHSEKWQESEKGEDFNLKISELQYLHYEIEDKIEAIEFAVQELIELLDND